MPKYLDIDSADTAAPLGGLASAVVEVTDEHGRARSDTLSVSVLDSAGVVYPGAAATTTRLDAGAYRVDVAGLDDADRYRVVVTGLAAVSWVQFDVVVSGPVAVPDLDDIKAYLKTGAAQYTDEQIQKALDAETSRQARNCTIPAGYAEDLADALRRRVARNLAAQALPLAYRLDPEGAAVRLAGEDAIVKRIEDHYPASAAA